MNYLEVIKRELTIEDDNEDELLKSIIDRAESKILQRLYPYQAHKNEIPKRYEYKVIDISIYMYNKRGAEGQTSHSENGISRGYESADVPESMVADIVPFVGVIK